jgi:hypothetical protein
MITELRFETVKFVNLILITDNDQMQFFKIVPDGYMTFDDTLWDYIVYDSYSELCNAYPDRIADIYPCEEGLIPPEEYM